MPSLEPRKMLLPIHAVVCRQRHKQLRGKSFLYRSSAIRGEVRGKKNGRPILGGIQHLPRGLLEQGTMSRVCFLDFYIVSLRPLRYHTYFKLTDSCAYIPLDSNLPQRAKNGWVKGECARQLGNCSTKHQRS